MRATLVLFVIAVRVDPGSTSIKSLYSTSFVSPSLADLRSEWSRDKLRYFLKRKAPNQDSTQTRISGKLLLSYIWPRHFRTSLNLGQNRVKFYVIYEHNVAMSQLRLNETRSTLSNRFQYDDPFCKYRKNLQFEQTKSRRDMIQKIQNNDHNQSSRSGKPGPCQITFTYYLSCRWKVG